MMNLEAQERLLEQVEHKIGLIRTYYGTESGAEELIDLYEEYRQEGATTQEISLFIDDLTLFLDTHAHSA